jgi:hypothetical protein
MMRAAGIPARRYCPCQEPPMAQDHLIPMNFLGLPRETSG